VQGELAKQIGNKTECGLLGFELEIGEDYNQMRQNYPNDSFVKCYTFNSGIKFLLVLQNENNF